MVIERERLAHLEAILDALRRDAAGNVVLVEGQKDVRALDALGVGGERMTVHQGRSIQATIDALAAQAGGRLVILLLDWDRTGHALFARIEQGLQGLARTDRTHRERLFAVCQAVCVEHIPPELAHLRQNVAANRGG